MPESVIERERRMVQAAMARKAAAEQRRLDGWPPLPTETPTGPQSRILGLIGKQPAS